MGRVVALATVFLLCISEHVFLTRWKACFTQCKDEPVYVPSLLIVLRKTAVIKVYK